MKTFLIVIVLLVGSNNLNAQSYFNDTLFYKSGLEKRCEIIKYDYDWVDIKAFNSKKDTVYSSVRTNQLKYFVNYDSLNNKTFSSREVNQALLKPKSDSIRVSPNLLSINPFSIPLLGLNMQFIHRFGKNLQWGFHVPLRIMTPVVWPVTYIQIGAGICFFPVTNEKFSMTLGLTPSFGFIEEQTVMTIPFTVGFVRYLTSRFALMGNFGVGPVFGIDFPIFPTGHIGFCFQLGEKRFVNLTKSTY